MIQAGMPVTVIDTPTAWLQEAAPQQPTTPGGGGSEPSDGGRKRNRNKEKEKERNKAKQQEGENKNLHPILKALFATASHFRGLALTKIMGAVNKKVPDIDRGSIDADECLQWATKGFCTHKARGMCRFGHTCAPCSDEDANNLKAQMQPGLDLIIKEPQKHDVKTAKKPRSD